MSRDLQHPLRREYALYEDAVAKHADVIARLRAGRRGAEPACAAADPGCVRRADMVPAVQGVIRRELADLDDSPQRSAHCRAGIRPASDGTQERIRTARSVFTPSPSPAIDDLDELYRWLVAWETYYRDLHDGHRAAAGYLAGLAGRVNSLGTDGHLDGLLLTELAEPFGEETRRWHRELVAKTHSARSAKHVKKPCPRCRLYTLWEEIGQEYIRCINKDCNRMMTRDELNQIDTAPRA